MVHTINNMTNMGAQRGFLGRFGGRPRCAVDDDGDQEKRLSSASRHAAERAPCDLAASVLVLKTELADSQNAADESESRRRDLAEKNFALTTRLADAETERHELSRELKSVKEQMLQALREVSELTEKLESAELERDRYRRRCEELEQREKKAAPGKGRDPQQRDEFAEGNNRSLTTVAFEPEGGREEVTNNDPKKKKREPKKGGFAPPFLAPVLGGRRRTTSNEKNEERECRKSSDQRKKDYRKNPDQRKKKEPSKKRSTRRASMPFMPNRDEEMTRNHRPIENMWSSLTSATTGRTGSTMSTADASFSAESCLWDANEEDDARVAADAALIESTHEEDTYHPASEQTQGTHLENDDSSSHQEEGNREDARARARATALDCYQGSQRILNCSDTPDNNASDIIDALIKEAEGFDMEGGGGETTRQEFRVQDTLDDLPVMEQGQKAGSNNRNAMRMAHDTMADVDAFFMGDMLGMGDDDSTSSLHSISKIIQEVEE